MPVDRLGVLRFAEFICSARGLSTGIVPGCNGNVASIIVYFPDYYRDEENRPMREERCSAVNPTEEYRVT